MFTPYIRPMGGIVADAEGTDPAVLAEEVLVLARVEEILGHLAFARQQAKTFGPGDRRPEPGAATDGTLASVARLAQVEVRLEPDRAAVAAASIGLLHASALE